MNIKLLSTALFICINVISFSQNTIQDIEGNKYLTVEIGGQVWMQENLKTTQYNNGDKIENLTDRKIWSSTTSGAYSVYEDKEKYKKEFGLLYNYYSIIDTRNVCPVGWRIPSDSDFVKLIEFLGGDKLAGGKIKEGGTDHWLKPNTGASRFNLFNALAIGLRSSGGDYYGLTTAAHFWSKTSTAQYYATAITVECFSTFVQKAPWFMNHGLSVRCIKN